MTEEAWSQMPHSLLDSHITGLKALNQARITNYWSRPPAEASTAQGSASRLEHVRHKFQHWQENKVDIPKKGFTFHNWIMAAKQAHQRQANLRDVKKMEVTHSYKVRAILSYSALYAALQSLMRCMYWLLIDHTQTFYTWCVHVICKCS